MRAIILLLSLYCMTTNAQVKANMWFFGNGAGLDFTTGQPSPILSGQLSTLEGCASAADANGNLLFYTNGVTVWNKQHQIMANGTGLFGDLSSSQAAVIVSKPGSDSEFYIFTTNSTDSSEGGLKYSRVDLNMNSGSGEVVEKNVQLYDSTCEKIAVIRHSNNVDYWIVTHVYGSDEFKAHLVTASGVAPSVASHAGLSIEIADDTANAIGYMKISPDGTRLIACHTYLKKAELFDFDTTTGVVSGGVMISDSGMHVYGAEFSSDSKLLYVSSVDEKTLWQYDLEASNIAGSQITVATLPHFLGALQMAPDGKIYIAMAETDRLSVIRRPEIKGMGCQLAESSVNLDGRTCMLGLPAFEASMFNNYITANEVCSGESAEFSVSTGQAISTVTWNFGDGQTANGNNITHTYAAPGEYIVSATAINPQATITKYRVVRILETPVAHSPGILDICINSNQPYSLSQHDSQILNGQASSILIRYFASQQDAEALSSPITEISLSLGQTSIFAVASNQDEQCVSMTQFILNSVAQPVVGVASDYVICESFPYDGVEYFDLSVKNAEVLSGQDPLIYSVSYHNSEADAESGVNPLASMHSNSQAEEIIYARVTNQFCYAITSFKIKVISQPKPAVIMDLAICDTTPWDGFATFDLSTKKSEILSGLSPDDYLVTFHKNSQDAVAGEYSLFETYSNITLSQTIYARVVHVDGNCPAVYPMQLIVRNCDAEPNVQPYSFMKFFTPNNDGANDTWKVISNHGNELLVSIFDRNGKLVKMIAGNGSGWDGTHNGQPMPANDYWFVVSGHNEQIRGHFSLMR